MSLKYTIGNLFIYFYFNVNTEHPTDDKQILR